MVTTSWLYLIAPMLIPYEKPSHGIEFDLCLFFVTFYSCEHVLFCTIFKKLFLRIGGLLYNKRVKVYFQIYYYY